MLSLTFSEGCLSITPNVSGIGEEAVSKSSIELQNFKL